MEEDGKIVLQDEEGNDIEFELLDTIEVDGNEYLVLLPGDEEESEEESVGVIILKMVENDTGDFDLVSVEDEEEEKVFEVFISRTEDDEEDDVQEDDSDEK
jgi:uncharacterized protein YrzB (UPF0473 family)